VPPTKVYSPNPLHPSVGSRIFFDFGRIPTSNPDANGNHWNSWHLVNEKHTILPGQSLGNLVTTDGNETGIDLVIAGEFETGSGGLRNPDPVALDDLAVPTATLDYFHRPDWSLEREVLMGGLMLTGLDPEDTYDFRFFATFPSSISQSTSYTLFGAGDPITGILQTSGDDIGGQNTDTTITIGGIRPDHFGQIFVDVESLPGHDIFLGVMEITVVPEPTSVILLLGMLALLTRRGLTVSKPMR
jgi:hypothetical protein